MLGKQSVLRNRHFRYVARTVPQCSRGFSINFANCRNKTDCPLSIPRVPEIRNCALLSTGTVEGRSLISIRFRNAIAKSASGSRSALHAKRSQGLFVRQALAMPSVVAVSGLLASLALTRLMKSLLFEVGPTDPLRLTYIAASSGLILAAFLGIYLPARRAMRVDPARSLPLQRLASHPIDSRQRTTSKPIRTLE